MIDASADSFEHALMLFRLGAVAYPCDDVTILSRTALDAFLRLYHGNSLFRLVSNRLHVYLNVRGREFLFDGVFHIIGYLMRIF